MGRSKQFLALLISLVVLTVLGYFVFLTFAIETQNIFLIYSVYIVAVIAGIATFFSPCSFGLLPAYLTFYSKTKGKKSPVYYGALSSFGLITFNILLGLIISFAGTGFAKELSVAAGGSLSPVTTVIRTIIGSLLLLLGIAQFFHISIFPSSLLRMGKKITERKKSPESSLYFYGFGYNLANIGCTGPILAGLIVFAASSGFTVALTAFVIYSLTMALLMVTVSSIVGSGKKLFITEKAHNIQRFGAIVLMFVGLFILWTVIFSPTFVKTFFP